MPLDMTQFHQVFFDETAEHLSTMESLLLYLDPHAPDSAQLEDLGRAAHSIRGAASAFGFREMADLAQEVEALIEGPRKGSGRLSEKTVDDLREACGVLRMLLAGHRGEGAPEADAAARAIALLRGKVSLRETAGEPAGAAGELRAWVRQTATATDEVMALTEAAGAGGLREVTAAVRELGQAIEQNAALVEAAAENVEALRESFRGLVRQIAAMALSPAGRNPAAARPRPLPKVRRASGVTQKGKAWPEF